MGYLCRKLELKPSFDRSTSKKVSNIVVFIQCKSPTFFFAFVIIAEGPVFQDLLYKVKYLWKTIKETWKTLNVKPLYYYFASPTPCSFIWRSVVLGNNYVFYSCRQIFQQFFFFWHFHQSFLYIWKFIKMLFSATQSTQDGYEDPTIWAGWTSLYTGKNLKIFKN